MRRIFYDWEFEEDGTTINPISLGMTSNDDQDLYIINADYMRDFERGYHRPSDWLKENVLAHISEEDVDKYGIPLKAFRAIVHNFVSDHGKIKSRKDVELWAYYAAYDHVALAQLWGPMIYLPEPIPMYTHELKQVMRSRIEYKPAVEHHPLSDAKWNKQVYADMTDMRNILRDNDSN